MTKRKIGFAVALAALVLAGPSLIGAMQQDGADGTAATTRLAADGPPTVEVWKGPRCGCCDKWIDHLEAAGFEVEVNEVPDVRPIKAEKGVPAGLSTCHTAEVGGYVVEGHVPADVIQRLLEERPAVAGIAVPGMPIGSPGMEEPGRAAEPYSVVAFTEDGSSSVYARR